MRGGAKLDFKEFWENGWGQRVASPPVENFFKKKSLFSGFEVKKKHFLIVVWLALRSMIYQILIVSMACSCV